MTITTEELQMLLAEATPGPWFHQERFSNVYSLSGGHSGETIHIAKASHEQVADGRLEAEANAHLIALAPELADRLITAEAERDATRAECARLRDIASEMVALEKWVGDSMARMHRDISDIQRGIIAEDVCADWFGSGVGASFGSAAKEARAALSPEAGQ